MSEQLDKSLAQQKEQLADLQTKKEQAELALKQLNEAIPQIKGAISALEYVKTLGLIDPAKSEQQSDRSIKAVK